MAASMKVTKTAADTTTNPENAREARDQLANSLGKRDGAKAAVQKLRDILNQKKQAYEQEQKRQTQAGASSQGPLPEQTENSNKEEGEEKKITPQMIETQEKERMAAEKEAADLGSLAQEAENWMEAEKERLAREGAGIESWTIVAKTGETQEEQLDETFEEGRVKRLQQQYMERIQNVAKTPAPVQGPRPPTPPRDQRDTGARGSDQQPPQQPPQQLQQPQKPTSK